MQISISAKQSRVLFRKDDYQVIIFKTIEGHKKKSFTGRGKLPLLTKSEEIVLLGEFKTDEKYGEQFHIEEWRRPIPNTEDQLIKFFSSGHFKGVGKKTAKLIVDNLGNSAIEEITSKGISCLISIENISTNLANSIVHTIHETFVLNQLIEAYAEYNVPAELLIKAQAKMGRNIIVLHENPYPLVDLKLVHFSTADEIAMKMGILPHSFCRVETVLKIVLNECIYEQGHCYLEEKDFISNCLYILNGHLESNEDFVHEQSVIQVIEESKSCIEEEGMIFPTSLYYAEKDVTEKIHSLTVSESICNEDLVKKTIRDFEIEKKLILSPEQREAINSLMEENVLILTGGPGTGKTFTVNAILSVYEKLIPNAKVALAAPTGRASKKLGEVTGMAKHAQTVHRLLGIGVLRHDKPLFDEAIPLPYSLIVVDEFSMIDIELAAKLFNAIQKGTKVLIVGDSDQLPSVGPGNVLKDMIDANIPHVRLNQIYRQAEGSKIVENAHMINRGENIDYVNSDDSYFIESNDSQRTAQLLVLSVMKFLRKGYHIQDIMVLSPMKKGFAGIDYLNKVLQNTVNPMKDMSMEVRYKDNVFRTHDKVMYLRTNKNLDLSNGDLGFIRSIKADKQELIVEFNNKEVLLKKEEWKSLQLAYASTIHKSQGSQAKVVMTVLAEEHSLMLTRNLAYTAITRAEEIHCLFGSKNAMSAAIATDRIRERKTRLKEKLEKVRRYMKIAL